MINAEAQQGRFMKSQRAEKIINSHWTFNYFDDKNAGKGCEIPGHDDSKWPLISIPHTWNTFETTGGMHPFIPGVTGDEDSYWHNGWGWYRKHFSIKQALTNRKVFVEFEGVQKYCRVWLNGKYLGDHEGGYGSFDFDITDHVVPGKDNVLAVAVSIRSDDKGAAAGSSSTSCQVHGGIYRDVTLVIKDKLYIPMQGSASHEGGTSITTPLVNATMGKARVQTWVKNDYPLPKECTLKTYLVDANNSVIQVVQTKQTIKQGEVFVFDQAFKTLKNPRLWSPANPYMYKVFSELIDGSRIADSYTSPLGFRWLTWDNNDNAFYLNGKKISFHGVAWCPGYPWLGGAIPSWMARMDLADMRESLNLNLARSIDQAGNKMTHDMTDQLGMMVMEEFPGINDESVPESKREQQAREIIRRGRNHPSIIAWSLGEATGSLGRVLSATAEDSTRFYTCMGAASRPAAMPVKNVFLNLKMSNFQSGAVRGWNNTVIICHEETAGHHAGTEEYQQEMLEAENLTGSGKINFLTYHDNGAPGEHLYSPLLNLNTSGVVDMFRIPKYSYYLLKAACSDGPVLFIQPHYWQPEYLGQKKDIVVVTNCEKAELKVNGISKGVRVPGRADSHTVIFEGIMIEKGTLSVEAYRGGKTASTSVVMADEPARIILSSPVQKIRADRSSVVIITADIVDSKGNKVQRSNNTITWSVSGPGTLVGPELYESDIEKNHAPLGTGYIVMPVSNLIRSTGKPGKIKIMASAGGIASGSVDIIAEEIKYIESPFIEPIPDDRARGPVSKPTFLAERLDEVPSEIKLSVTGFNINPATRPVYSSIIREHIFKNNPSVDTTSVEFKTLNLLLAKQLLNNNGQLSAEDYNFNVSHFNNCRVVTGFIPTLKLPQLFKEGLRQYYADLLIKGGNERDPGEEMNWMNWIPSGGTVVISTANKNPARYPKGTILTKMKDIEDIISLVYPVFRSYSPDAKDRALTFIGKMNPYIRVKRVPEHAGSGNAGAITRNLYIVEKDKPVLIPLLKFISG
jgi:hypothetical protein